MPCKKWRTENILTSMLALAFLGPVNAAVQKGPYLIYREAQILSAEDAEDAEFVALSFTRRWVATIAGCRP
jgi:hypothetical protein